jgi:hypothetical protein
MMQAESSRPAWNFGAGAGTNPCIGSGAALGGRVRLARVAVLRKMIAAGTYRISSSELAEKMIGVFLPENDEPADRYGVN